MPDPLDGLTRSQLAAVTHAGGPLLVLGGAGTGKTQVLARRFAWLAAEGTRPDAIAVLTLTPRSAASLLADIDALVDPPYDELTVTTSQAFAERVLRDHPGEAGLDPAFVTVTRADRVALLLDRIDELSLRHHEIGGNPAPLLAGFVERIDRLKDEMVAPEQLVADAASARAAADAAGDAERIRAAQNLEFARLYADHDRLLAETGALDRGELVLRAFQLLHEKPHVRARLAERFSHILVDEYQDLGFAQGMLIGLLGEERRELTVAGDDDQAVVRSRGAGPRLVRDFEREFPGAAVVRLGQSHRCPQVVLDAATAVVEPVPSRIEKAVSGHDGGAVRFWRCTSERAQAQAVAAAAERALERGAEPDSIAVLVRSVAQDGPAVAAALEERALPFRVVGPGAFFQRAEVRDVLAWLRLLADPADSGAAVRALTRPPVSLHSVDIARLTQLARRRKLPIPAAVSAALEGPQLTPEGRDRAQAFLRLYRAASNAYEDRRPDAFVLRLIERIGVRRQQVFATQADTVERLRNIARLPELAAAFLRRDAHATTREFTRYLKAVADSGLPSEEAEAPAATPAIRVLEFADSKGLEFDHVMVLGLTASRLPGRDPTAAPGGTPRALVTDRGDGGHDAAARRLLHVAMTRTADNLVLAWAESGNGSPAQPSPYFEAARAAVGAEQEVHEEELFGPAEGLHSSFRIMRDELLDTTARIGGQLGEMRLDTGVDVSEAVARYLELLKIAALIERAKTGQPIADALREVNELLAMGASPEQRELLAASALDDWLRDTGRDTERRPGAGDAGQGPSLDPFIPRRRGAGADPAGLMLSASDIETYRVCPLKYKFARVFRIPQEPTIHQRSGIALHQVLERFHQPVPRQGASQVGTLEDLLELFETAWRRQGFGGSDDELQFRERAIEALERYWESARDHDGEPVWFERSFSFTLGPHVVRGRVDRVDRRPDGSYELIDYKTGAAKTADDLRGEVQLSIYQMAARESWDLDAAAGSYWYVMSGERIPVASTEPELDRVRSTVTQIGEGILRQDFQPTPSPEICSYCDYRILCPAAER